MIWVRQDGESKVSQYGQWDGYASGQGLTILRFLKTVNMESFRERVRALRFLRTDEFASTNKLLQESADVLREFPEFHRDTGGEILQLIMDREPGLVLNDNGASGQEWNYTIDLDTNMLIVHGWRQANYSLTALPTEEKFLKDLEPKDD
jgi:hypothetical protein